MKKINIGCGNKKMKGYLNVDINQKFNPDKIVDANKELPFNNNTFDEVLMLGVIPYLDNIPSIFQEIHRVLKKEGEFLFNCDHFAGRLSKTYHNKNHPFRIRDFYELDKDWRKKLKESDFLYYPFDFELVECRIVLPKGFHIFNNFIERLINWSYKTKDIYETTFLKALFPSEHLEVVLKKK